MNSLKTLISLILVALYALSGCGGDSGAPVVTSADIPATSSMGAVPVINPSPTSPFRLVPAFPQLSFARPVVATHANDGSNRLFVAELGGTIKVFDNQMDTTTSEVFLDLSGVVLGNERGLLGLAFDPNYSTNGFFYVCYSAATPTAGQDNRSIVSRFKASLTNPNQADSTSETVLLSWDQPAGNHNGGCLAFGPDEMLYIGSGDGGGSGDPGRTAQDLSSPLGKILRVRTDGTAPPDNPFVGQAGARADIWAYGLRNPWRFSFDSATGILWNGDVGQNTTEEINLIVKAGNYGWSLFEGTEDFNNPGDVPLANTVSPIFSYSHQVGQSITGGVVSNGTYFYGDFVTGDVWALVWDGQRVVSNLSIGDVQNPASFGTDASGTVLVCSFDGSLYRVERI